MNIKKMLKDGAKDVLPDEKVKENIKYRMGIDDAVHRHGGVKLDRRRIKFGTVAA